MEKPGRRQMDARGQGTTGGKGLGARIGQCRERAEGGLHRL